MKMKYKRCRACGDKYFVGNMKLEINIDHKDIESLENALFTSSDLNKKEKKRVNKIWVQICESEDKFKKKMFKT